MKISEKKGRKKILLYNEFKILVMIHHKYDILLKIFVITKYEI